MTKRAVYKHNALRPYRSIDLIIRIEAHRYSGTLKKTLEKRIHQPQEKSVNNSQAVSKKPISKDDDSKL